MPGNWLSLEPICSGVPFTQLESPEEIIFFLSLSRTFLINSYRDEIFSLTPIFLQKFSDYFFDYFFLTEKEKPSISAGFQTGEEGFEPP